MVRGRSGEGTTKAIPCWPDLHSEPAVLTIAPRSEQPAVAVARLATPTCVMHLVCCEYKNGRSGWIETVELDERNIVHATTRVSATEISEVFINNPVFR